MSVAVANQWGTERFTAARRLAPATLDALATALTDARAEGLRVKPIGGGHSFNAVIRTAGVVLDLAALNRIGPVEGCEIEAEAGATIGDLIVAAEAAGVHFPTLGSWHSQTIAGAIATSTHGSSLRHGSLSELVVWVEAMLADGALRRFDGGDALRAFACHLGQLGVVTKVRLRLAPAFHLACAHDALPDDAGFDAMIDRARAAEYLNVLWTPYGGECLFRELRRIEATGRNAAARALERAFTCKSRFGHTVEDLRNWALGHAFLRAPRLLAGPYSRAVRTAFREDDGVVDRSPRVFLYDQYREPTENRRLRLILNVEHALPLDRLPDAMRALKALTTAALRRGVAINYPRVNVRFAPRSEATLIGLNADRDTAYVGLYVVASIRHAPQIALATAMEQALADHGGRPHWGKYSYLGGGDLAGLYPGMARFLAVRDALDPDGLFRDGADPFAGLNRFRDGVAGKLRSLAAPDTYRPIRLL